mmetsp:Transcript_40021/g.119787  ORF Transcript_40021/g.119787 Transcript_40021/m.119787 type:complete len:221 (+) Transcript_40021:312-974(+)
MRQRRGAARPPCLPVEERREGEQENDNASKDAWLLPRVRRRCPGRGLACRTICSKAAQRHQRHLGHEAGGDAVTAEARQRPQSRDAQNDGAPERQDCKGAREDNDGMVAEVWPRSFTTYAGHRLVEDAHGEAKCHDGHVPVGQGSATACSIECAGHLHAHEAVEGLECSLIIRFRIHFFQGAHESNNVALDEWPVFLLSARSALDLEVFNGERQFLAQPH